MIEAHTVDTLSTIKLLESIEALYPLLALIQVLLDNASYHHAKIVREWLAQPGRAHKVAFHPGLLPAFELDLIFYIYLLSFISIEPLAKLPQLDEPSAFLASMERSC